MGNSLILTNQNAASSHQNEFITKVFMARGINICLMNINVVQHPGKSIIEKISHDECRAEWYQLSKTDGVICWWNKCLKIILTINLFFSILDKQNLKGKVFLKYVNDDQIKLDKKFNRQTLNDKFIFYINFWLLAHTTVLTTASDLVITWI